MSMQGVISFPGGRVAGAHRVESVEFRRKSAADKSAMFTRVYVHSFGNAEQMATDSGLQWQEPLDSVVPAEAVDPADPFGSVEKWLIENITTYTPLTYTDGTEVGTDVAAARYAKMQSLTLQYGAVIEKLVEGYPKVERDSWPQQVDEARDFQANPATPTPWLTACAEKRGIEKADLAQKILAMNTPYRVAHGSATGTRQKAEALLNEAKTVEDVNAVMWDFSTSTALSRPAPAAPVSAAPAPTAAPAA